LCDAAAANIFPCPVSPHGQQQPESAKQGLQMNVINSQVGSDAVDQFEPDESDVSKMTAEILPACFLLGIIAGFSAFVLFGQAILPAIVAAFMGAMLGLFFACDGRSAHEPLGLPRERK
jgi:hypothetical protein